MNTNTSKQTTHFDNIADFVIRASENKEAVAAARVWVSKRGGDLSMADIRRLRAAIREVEGYDQLDKDYYEFMDDVANGIMSIAF